MARVIPDTLVRDAAELIKNGAKLKDAATSIGCNPDDLSKKFRAIGFAFDKRIDWESMADRIIALYQTGMGTTAIAKELGTPRHSASNIGAVLIRRGIMRQRSDANLERFSKASRAERKAVVNKARETRRRNMIDAATDAKARHGIGFGEAEVANVLIGAGLDIRQQVIVRDNYLIDITLGHLAIEIKTSSLAAHFRSMRPERVKELTDAGFVIVFLVVNHAGTILSHADDIVAALKFVHGNPTSPGQHWVVKCTLEQIGADLDVDHFSIEKRTPKSNGPL